MSDIPGNQDLSTELKTERIRAVYEPFHQALSALMRRRELEQASLVTIHSFTPDYQGASRSCEIGILHDSDTRLADAILKDWPKDAPWRAWRNEPYGPEDGVTHTLKEYALALAWPNVMIEIRNDLIATEAAQAAVAKFLSHRITRALLSINGEAHV